MKNKGCRYATIIAIILICIISNGCKKYLDAKPDKKLIVLSTLQDCQALLDEYTDLNQNDPSAAEFSCDNYYLIKSDFDGLTENYRRMYYWGEDLFMGLSSNDWVKVYNVVYIANTVLDNIEKIEKGSNPGQWNNVKGQALVHRAKAFLQGAIIWTLAYDENTASTDLGLPLRLNADFNEKSVRSSVQETYDQIITDLKAAIPLLPEMPLNVLRPSKLAAYAFLSRTYLAMREYDQALLYADSVLQKKSTLLDYNENSVSKTGTAAAFVNITFNTNPVNPEIIMQSRAPSPSGLANTRARIDSALYQSYVVNDLRKAVYFRSITTTPPPPTYGFRGSYDGGAALFTGIATDEMYLTRAECYARNGNKNAALKDLDSLMRKRWNKAVPYSPITALDANDALNKVLNERRKELIYRCLRWMDIKRLNKEGYNITLKRIVDGTTYLLPPNDLKYALPLPEEVIAISGMPQNPR